MKTHIKYLLTENVAIAVVLVLCVLGIVKYIDYRFNALAIQIENSNSVIAQSEETLNGKIKDLGEVFFSTLSEEQQKNEDIKKELGNITDTVDELEKLSATDKELLKKYSKVYFLNEHYVPLSLSEIPEEWRSKTATSFQIHSEALPYLEDLMEEAEDEGLDPRVQSAYRSFAKQTELKSSYTVTYGSGANRFSADQGYSEHQLGTTMDFTTTNTNGTLVGFNNTPEYKWFLDNAYRFGFVLSYPEGNAYYKFEPWHWRFVGVDLARRLHKENINFYDMDQRIIDSYLVKIFD